MKHCTGIILIIDRKELIWVLDPANMSSQLVPTVATAVQVNKLQLSLSRPAADLLIIPLWAFCSSPVAPPGIFLRRLLVHALLRHGHHWPRPACVRLCPPVAEVSCCSPISYSSTCLWECRLGLLPWRLPDQSDSRTERWRKWVCTSLCVFLCMRGGTFKLLNCCVLYYFLKSILLVKSRFLFSFFWIIRINESVGMGYFPTAISLAHFTQGQKVILLFVFPSVLRKQNRTWSTSCCCCLKA